MENAVEYDLYLKLAPENIHLLTYILEGHAHMMNVRNKQENGFLKVIVPKDMMEDSLKVINSLNAKFPVEVVKIEPHDGLV